MSNASIYDSSFKENPQPDSRRGGVPLCPPRGTDLDHYRQSIILLDAVWWDVYSRGVNYELKRNSGNRTAKEYRRDAYSTRCREDTGGTPAPLRRQHVFGAFAAHDSGVCASLRLRRTRLSAGKRGPIYVSAKRTHRFGGRFFVYHPYVKIFISFAGPVCRWVRFGKRTHRGGVSRVFSLKSGVILGRKWVRFTSKFRWRAFEPLTLILCHIRQRVCRGSIACGVSRTRLVQLGSPGGERRWLRGAAAANIATEISLPRSGPKRSRGGWLQEFVSQAGGFG